MFGTFFKFEIGYWLRGMMVYIFLFVIGLMIFGAVSSDNVQVGVALENTHRNSPFAIQNFYAIMALLTSLMITAFVNSAASRDFMYDTSQILFTKPLRKFGFLMGRFWGATLVAVIPMLGISLGVIVGAWMPWNDPDRWGPISWGAHVASVLVFAIPNTIFVAALVFAIAVWTRSTMASFIGVVMLMVGYSVASAMLGDLDNETVAQLIDPFGINTYNLLTKYWTVADRNTRYLGLSGMMLWNRLLWLALGLSVLAISCWRFSFAERARRGRVDTSRPSALAPIPTLHGTITLHHGTGAHWSQFWSQCRTDMLGIVKSNVFIVVMLAGFVNTVASLYFSASEGFGLGSLPVTYTLIDIIRGALYAFIVAVITFYAGVLVWKERDSHLDEVLDATPHSAWTSYLAKLMALVGVIAMILLVSIVAGTLFQMSQGYHRYQWDLYALELLGLDLTRFVCLIVLAMLAHAVSPNKYFGYFLFIAVLIANAFGWSMLRIDSALVRYGHLPTHTYSDLYGFAPFQAALSWFAIYWLLFAALLGMLTIFLWQRGRETGWSFRLRSAAQRFQGPLRIVACLLFLIWCGTAGWVYYNTRVLNEFRSPRKNEQRLARYERRL
ncbi:MAG TPA: ABC transporter permease, partial [Pirellulaceae bacterium]